jgi:phosphopantothenoylcysteine decarboxylase/phosphopantothenate--cysteine ligase
MGSELLAHSKKLKNRKILITAGPTWVALDKVRVISNIATGETGTLLAEDLVKLGAKVTLILGPVTQCCLNKKIRILPFKYFDELDSLVRKEVSTKSYDLLIHSAAVSDYRPKVTSTGKVSSKLTEWKLKLVPTKKIINQIKSLDPGILLVGFKFIPCAKDGVLIKNARALLENAGAELAIANAISGPDYKAFILDKTNIIGPLHSRKEMIAKLIKLI